MGQKTTGIYSSKVGDWNVDKWYYKDRIRQSGFRTYAEAEGWLIKKLEELRQVKLLGERPHRTFDSAAARYLRLFKDKRSIETEMYQLKSVMPFIGSFSLDNINDETLAPYIEVRRAAGRKNKTINLSIGVVRHILNLAENSWKHENGMAWLERAPKITLLPLAGFQRAPHPITWGEQNRLIPQLPKHLAQMVTFMLNTGLRDSVVCNLKWDWEIRVSELGVSVFEVPAQFVKGEDGIKVNRAFVCNSVSQEVIECMRGRHPEFVFVYRRERIKNLDVPPSMPYRPIETMNNTAWQRARAAADLGDLHVHDLRHTVATRLREAGAAQQTISDILWHSKRGMTAHYTLAQLRELHEALEKVSTDSGRWNRSLSMLKREHASAQLNRVP